MPPAAGMPMSAAHLLILHEGVLDTYLLSKLVEDHCYLVSVLLRQDVLDKSRLA
jgi:hypothetical protein